MPTAADRLSSKSSADEIQTAISSCISQLADEHPDWDNDRRVAACHSMARQAGANVPAPPGEKPKRRRIT